MVMLDLEGTRFLGWKSIVRMKQWIIPNDPIGLSIEISD